MPLIKYPIQPAKQPIENAPPKSSMILYGQGYSRIAIFC